MDKNSLRCLINSISRFIHLVACHTVKTLLIQKDFVNMVGLLKLLKPVLDDVDDSTMCLDELLVNEFEELDMVVNEAREFMEKWCPKMSKIHSVLQTEPLAMKVQSSTLEITHILYRLFHLPPITSHLASIERYIQDCQSSEHERISEFIKEAIGDQRAHIVPRAEILVKIMKSLNLISNLELLTENVALEKERAKAQVFKNKEESDLIDQILDLIGHIRDCIVEHEMCKGVNAKGLPAPPYFRCPLSLELMMDPVILASGQTYEKVFIQKWLDQGMAICPRTRQTLAHTNLIPNYTVRSLIGNWCEDNNIRFSNTIDDSSSSTSPSSHHVSPDQHNHNTHNFYGSLHRKNSSSGSFHEVRSVSEKQRVEFSSNHNSSSGYTEVSGLSSRDTVLTELSVDVATEFPASSPLNKHSKSSPCLSEKQLSCSRTREAIPENENENDNHHRSLSLPYSELSSDDLTTSYHVERLVEDLRSPSNESQTAAAAELRLLAKHNMENRIVIAQCGAIAPLVSLLYSMVKLTQEHAVTALLNLSINEDNKVMIAEAGALDPLILILKSGSVGAKENSAATLFSLSVLEQYKIKIGRSGAVKALVDLLGCGTLRGKKDAATALFNLSIFHENKARIVQAGAVKYLIKLMDPDSGMADKAIALLANLSTIPEGRSAITSEEGIPLIVEVIEMGSQRGKENAAFILWQLCISNHKFCSLILQEGAVPPLVALAQSGTRRAKEKAQQILGHFRDQREGAVGKTRS